MEGHLLADPGKSDSYEQREQPKNDCRFAGTIKIQTF